MLPANVQEAWRHPSKPILYMAWSDRGPGAGSPAGNHHGLTAFTIDGVSGALKPHGPAVTRAAFEDDSFDGRSAGRA